jgi:hypothetical protein
VHALFEHVGEHWDEEAIEEDFWVWWLVGKENFLIGGRRERTDE